MERKQEFSLESGSVLSEIKPHDLLKSVMSDDILVFLVVIVLERFA